MPTIISLTQRCSKSVGFIWVQGIRIFANVGVLLYSSLSRRSLSEGGSIANDSYDDALKYILATAKITFKSQCLHVSAKTPKIGEKLR